MPSIKSAPKSDFNRSNNKQRSDTALIGGIVRIIQNEGPNADITKVTVPSHEKLNAYLDTKPRDDPWSPYAIQKDGAVRVPSYDKLKAYLDIKAKDDPWLPYTIQNAAAGVSRKEYK